MISIGKYDYKFVEIRGFSISCNYRKKIFFELKPVLGDRGDSGDHFALVDDLPSPKGTHVMNVLNSANFAENCQNIRISMTS